MCYVISKTSRRIVFLRGPCKLDRVVVFETNNDLSHFVLVQDGVEELPKLFLGHPLNHRYNQQANTWRLNFKELVDFKNEFSITTIGVQWMEQVRLLRGICKNHALSIG